MPLVVPGDEADLPRPYLGYEELHLPEADLHPSKLHGSGQGVDPGSREDADVYRGASPSTDARGTLLFVMEYLVGLDLAPDFLPRRIRMATTTATRLPPVIREIEMPARGVADS